MTLFEQEVTEKIVIEVKKLIEDVTPPSFSHEGDACADIRSSENLEIQPGSVVMVPTGIAIAVPMGYEAQVRPRSGLAAKNSIGVLNSPGTIDSGYRGEIKIIMINLGTKPFSIKKKDRIAQIAVRKVPEVNFVLTSELSDTKRGTGGFGSTGVK